MRRQFVEDQRNTILKTTPEAGIPLSRSLYLRTVNWNIGYNPCFSAWRNQIEVPSTLKPIEFSAHTTNMSSSISATTSAAYVSYSYMHTSLASQAPPNATRSELQTFFSAVSFLFFPLRLWAPTNSSINPQRAQVERNHLFCSGTSGFVSFRFSCGVIAIAIILVGNELGAFSLISNSYISFYSRACQCRVCVCVSVHREGKQNINQQSVLCSIGYHRCRSGEYSCTDFLWYKSPQTIFLEQEGCLQTPCFQMCRPPVHTKHEPVLLKGTK